MTLDYLLHFEKNSKGAAIEAVTIVVIIAFLLFFLFVGLNYYVPIQTCQMKFWSYDDLRSKYCSDWFQNSQQFEESKRPQWEEIRIHSSCFKSGDEFDTAKINMFCKNPDDVLSGRDCFGKEPDSRYCKQYSGVVEGDLE